MCVKQQYLLFNKHENGIIYTISVKNVLHHQIYYCSNLLVIYFNIY